MRGSERGALTNLGAHDDLGGVREVIDAPRHGGVRADAEGGLLRSMLACPLLLFACAATLGELSLQR